MLEGHILPVLRRAKTLHTCGDLRLREHEMIACCVVMCTGANAEEIRVNITVNQALKIFARVSDMSLTEEANLAPPNTLGAPTGQTVGDHHGLGLFPYARRQSSVWRWEPAIGPICSIPPSMGQDTPVT